MYLYVLLQRMAQGNSKHKSKAGAPPTKKTKGKAAQNGVTKNGNIKKGKFTIAPKKQVKFFLDSKYSKYFVAAPPSCFQVQGSREEDYKPGQREGDKGEGAGVRVQALQRPELRGRRRGRAT